MLIYKLKLWQKLSIIFLSITTVFIIFVLNGEPQILNAKEFKNLQLNAQVDYLERASEQIKIPELNKFIKSAYPDEPNDKHELAHKLGELAVNKNGISGFGLCDSVLQFGCFHGAALAAVRLKGDDPNLGRELLVGCKNNEGIPGSCLHGLGHAILIINKYNLISAYKECERLLNKHEAFWCQDGVSMENIVRSMAPSGLGSYGKKDDIYYPCNSIPNRFEASCVRNHIGYLKRSRGMNFNESINFCSSFDAEKTRQECLNVVGSLIASSHINIEDMVRECSFADSFMRFCLEGAVVSYSMSKQFDRAEKLCNTLKDESHKNSCFGIIKSFSSAN